MQIFLSYRRGDAVAGRLSDVLRQRLGAKSVFQDVTAIAPGQDYTTAIDRALDGCDAVLVMIGPGRPRQPHRAPRDCSKPMTMSAWSCPGPCTATSLLIPVLVGGAGLPAATELPDDLQGLVHRQGVILHDETWHQDVEGLLRSLRGQPAAPPGRRRRWLVPASGAALVVLAGLGAAAGWWGPGRDGGSGDGGEAGADTGILACAPPQGQGWSPIALGGDPTGQEKIENGSLVFRVKEAYQRGGRGRWQVLLATSMENATPEPAYHGDWRYSSLVVGQRQNKATCFAPTPNLVESQTVGDALIGFEVSREPSGYIQLILENDSARISVTDDTQEPAAC